MKSSTMIKDSFVFFSNFIGISLCVSLVLFFFNWRAGNIGLHIFFSIFVLSFLYLCFIGFYNGIYRYDLRKNWKVYLSFVSLYAGIMYFLVYQYISYKKLTGTYVYFGIGNLKEIINSINTISIYYFLSCLVIIIVYIILYEIVERFYI